MTQDNYPFPVMAEEFKNKRVLVTGGTKGAGEAMVRRFLLSGALVATVARSTLPDGQEPTLLCKPTSEVPREYRSLPSVSSVSGAEWIFL